jgi:hypothetical protein
VKKNAATRLTPEESTYRNAAGAILAGHEAFAETMMGIGHLHILAFQAYISAALHTKHHPYQHHPVGQDNLFTIRAVQILLSHLHFTGGSRSTHLEQEQVMSSGLMDGRAARYMKAAEAAGSGGGSVWRTRFGADKEGSNGDGDEVGESQEEGAPSSSSSSSFAAAILSEGRKKDKKQKQKTGKVTKTTKKESRFPDAVAAHTRTDCAFAARRCLLWLHGRGINITRAAQLACLIQTGGLDAVAVSNLIVGNSGATAAAAAAAASIQTTAAAAALVAACKSVPDCSSSGMVGITVAPPSQIVLPAAAAVGLGLLASTKRVSSRDNYLKSVAAVPLDMKNEKDEKGREKRQAKSASSSSSGAKRARK